jgi:hypothetical protein
MVADQLLTRGDLTVVVRPYLNATMSMIAKSYVVKDGFLPDRDAILFFYIY